MTSKKGDFSDDVKLKCLLWSDRHCCLCGKQCGINIEVHHIIPKAKIKDKEKASSIDNAIPLCFDCHGLVESYNPTHPKGKNFSELELKARRNQIYNKYTQNLISPIHYEITQKTNRGSRALPDVGFIIQHLGESNLLIVHFALDVFLDEVNLGLVKTPNRIYCGEKPIYLHPKMVFSGHFPVPYEAVDSDGTLEVRVNLKVEDIYGKFHYFFPFGYVYMRDTKDWFFEPSVSLHKGEDIYELKGWGKPGDI